MDQRHESVDDLALDPVSVSKSQQSLEIGAIHGRLGRLRVVVGDTDRVKHALLVLGEARFGCGQVGEQGRVLLLERGPGLGKGLTYSFSIRMKYLRTDRPIGLFSTMHSSLAMPVVRMKSRLRRSPPWVLET